VGDLGIFDPSAPVAERWKLIWHQYLNANLTSFFTDLLIGFR